MKRSDITESAKTIGPPVALTALALGVGVWLAPDAVLPPPPPPARTATYYFALAPGACLTVVEGSTNPAGPWVELGRVTNAPTGQQIIGQFSTPEREMYFFRSYHPNIVGHYWDMNVWRVNYKMWGLE